MPKQEPREQVQQIPMSEIHPFRNHPFKVLDDELMQQTIDSIMQVGILNPAIIRPDPEGGYEMVAGHRRLYAADLAGLKTIPAIVRNLTDDEAVILMVDSNLQRETISPMERAQAYKMKLEALKHQGKKVELQADSTSPQLGEKSSWAVSIVANDANASRSQVQRFIRLTELLPEVQEKVESKEIAFSPAVELSYLMLLKCRYIDEITDSKGVVFATGTPVSNSMTELYTMMRYLQHDAIRGKGLAHFDCWASTFGETQTAIELAPEGTGYRARTRFAKFFNLPELMTLFKEVADIKTSDQLNLPTPTPIYHNEVAQPTEIQKEMVQELSERAAKVHAQLVDPSTDNMLKITSDGRKLGLDQRVINPDLPDDPNSKVNMCVNNIAKIYEAGKAEKLTQLVFCDLSTPKTAPSQRAAKTAGGNLDSPEMNALERLIDSENPDESGFTVYDDIRDKLVARGIPREEIAFIHEANTEARKKELFAKVRSGQVRVLMGSTFKMGAGMNVQDRLVALHDLDCPWRPGDLEQRSGRIIRQGNMNPEVHIYRYVTESTFDAYLWQTVKNKQKFISQIMTSKSPVRSCEDVDETALSYAEIKALCAGDDRIKEKMDLDVDVARLKLMKANHLSQQFCLEDNLLKTFPEQIRQNESFIEGFTADLKTLSEHPHPKDGFAGMEVKGDILTDKDNAGAAILEAFKDAKGMEPVPIGSYRGFAMSLTVEDFGRDFVLTLKGKMNHRVTLGKDARGNLTRIDNALNGIPERMQAVQDKLANLREQVETAKAELGKPFPQEEELRTKSSRLAELNAELNIDDRTPMEQIAEDAPSAEIAKAKPSVLEKLKAPIPQTHAEVKGKHREADAR